MNSQKKSFLITGANSALGSALVKDLLQDKNSRVLASTRSLHDFEIPENKDFKVVSGIDLLNEESLSKLATEADTFFDGEFHVINAVGRYFENGHQYFSDVSVVEAQEIFLSNFVAVYNTAKYLVPVQIKKSGGHFIGFSCTSTVYKYPTMSAFASAKAALETFIGCLANEHFKDRIISNSIQLSTLNTEEERRLKPNGDFEHWLELTDVSEFIYSLVGSSNQLLSGNNLHIYQPSATFFGNSYLNRIGK